MPRTRPHTRPSTSPATPLSPPIAPSPPQLSTLQPCNPRPSLNIPGLEAGCIVWLPSKDLKSDSSSNAAGGKSGRSIRCIRASCCGNAALDEEGYNHPVVVLKTSKYYWEDKMCFVAIITSQNHNGRRDRLPISQEAPPASPQPPNGSSSNNKTTTIIELYLENTAKMNKQSYIVLTHIYQLRASYLRSRSFRSGSRSTDTRLREESYALLMSRMGLQRGVWIQTASAVCKVDAPSPGPSPKSRTAEGARRGRQSRVARGGRKYADGPVAVRMPQFVPQVQTPQSARVQRALRQVSSRSSAAVKAGVSSPAYMQRTHNRPFLGGEAPLRIPGAWPNAGHQVGRGGAGGTRGYGYGGTWNQGERLRRWESELPRGEEEKSWFRFYFKVVVVLLVAVSVLWWMWMWM